MKLLSKNEENYFIYIIEILISKFVFFIEN